MPLFVFKRMITFLGAASLFGRVASALLKVSPSIRHLKLYDEADCVHTVSSAGKSSCFVQWHRSKEQLTSALEGSDIVVIGDECIVMSENEKESMLAKSSKIIDYAFAIAHAAPRAVLVVAASPLNVMVPLIGYVLKELGCYDGRKLLGVTSIDTLRANALYSSYLKQPNAILPVVGGSSPQTRVPIFSHAKPFLLLPEDDQHSLIEQIKSFDLERFGQENKASAIERAYATVRLVHSVISGLFEEPYAAEMALAKTSLIPEVSYFSLPVDLGKTGIERTFGLPELSSLESEMIDYAVINLNNDLMKAYDLYATFKPCFDLVKNITGHSNTIEYPRDSCLSRLEPKDRKVVENKSLEDNVPTRKSNHKKRGEPRNHKKVLKDPTLHCPAPDIVKDKPKAEKFGRINRARKQLEMNKTELEKKRNELFKFSFKKEDEKEEDVQSPTLFFEKDSIIKEIKIAKDNKTKKRHIRPSLNDNARYKNEQNMLFSKKSIKKNKKEAEVPIKKIKTGLRTVTQENKAKNSFACLPLVWKKCIEKNEKRNLKNSHGKKKSVQHKSRCEHNSKSLQNNIEGYHNKIPKAGTDFNSSEILNISKSAINYKKNASKNAVKQVPIENANCLKIERKTSHLFQEKKERNSPSCVTKFSKKENAVGMVEKGGLSRKIKNSIENDIKKEENRITNKEKIMAEKKTAERNSEKIMKADLWKREEADSGEMKIKENAALNEIFVVTKEKFPDQDKVLNKPKEKLMVNEFEHNSGPIANSVEACNHCSASEVNIRGSNEKNTFATKSSSLEGNSYKKKDSILLDQNRLKANSIVEKAFNENVVSNADELFTYSKKLSGKERFDAKEIKGDCESIAPCKPIIEDGSFVENIDTSAQLKHNKENVSQGKPQDSEKSVDITNKVFISRKDILDRDKLHSRGKPKLESAFGLAEIETPRRKGIINKDMSEKCEISISKIDSSEQGNKIREITKQKFVNDPKSSLKHEDQEKNNETARETATSFKESIKHPENIQSFSYLPKQTAGNKDVNNINDTLHNLVKGKVSEQVTTLPITEITTKYQTKENLHDGIMAKEKLVKIAEPSVKENAKGLKEVSGKTKVENNVEKNFREEPSMTSLPLSDKGEMKITQQLESKKQMNVVSPLPSKKNDAKIVREENSLKNILLLQRARPQKQGDSPSKVDLNKILENKRVSVNSYNIDQSFTQKEIKKGMQLSNKASNNKQVTFTIGKKSKKDELSKRYTILKKGQICTMIKEDINANELRNRLYKKSSQFRSNKHNGSKESEINANDLLAEFEMNKTVNTSKTNITAAINLGKRDNTNSLPSCEKGTKEKKDSISKTSCTTRDVIHPQNLKRSNKNAMNLENKSFFNSILNRISKAAPSLSETIDTISIRGSHNTSADHKHKKPSTPEEQKITNQKLIKKAKEQLNLTKLKNNIKGYNVQKYPVVSRDFSDKKNASTVQVDKSITDKISHQKTMADVKNKMQLLKEKHQHLKMSQSITNRDVLLNLEKRNEVLNRKETNDSRFEVGLNLNQKRSENAFSVNGANTILKNQSEQKSTSDKIDKDKQTSEGPSQDLLHSSLEKPAKEVFLNTEKPVKEVLLKAENPVNEFVQNTENASYEQMTSALLGRKDESLIDSFVSTFKNHETNDSSIDNENIRSIDMQMRNFQDVSSQTSSQNSDDKTWKSSYQNINQENIKSQDTSKINNENSVSEINKKISENSTLETSKAVNRNLTISKENLQKKRENDDFKLSKNTNIKLKISTSSNPKKPSAFQKPSTAENKAYQTRAQFDDTRKSTQNNSQDGDIMTLLDSLSRETRKSNKSDINPLDKISKLKNELSKYKPMNENKSIEPAALNLFAKRKSSKEIVKMKAEGQITEYNTAKPGIHGNRNPFPAVKLVYGGIGENKLMPNHSAASSLLLDPNYENKTLRRKEIPPSLLHAVKPFTTLNAEPSKLKNNFYMRWSPQSLMAVKEENNEIERLKKLEGRTHKNPFTSGKACMTSDLFKEYMKKNRNYEFNNANSNGYKSSQTNGLALAPPQSKTRNDQVIMTSNQLGPKSGSKKKLNHKVIDTQQKVMKFNTNLDFFNSIKPEAVTKCELVENEVSVKPEGLVFNRGIKNILASTENYSKVPTAKSNVKKILYGSYKPYSSLKSKYNNQPSGKITRTVPVKEKEEDIKKMHLLKAFMDHDKTEQQFEELNRNFKKRKGIDAEIMLKPKVGRVFRPLDEGYCIEGTPKRLHLLKAFAQEFKRSAFDHKPRSSPPDYHPSFPLSKPKKLDKDKKKEETTTSLKKRFSQLLDIFHSVISTEKKSWEQNIPEKKLLLTDGSTGTKKPGPKVAQRLNRINSSGKKLHNYYRRYSGLKANPGRTSQ